MVWGMQTNFECLDLDPPELGGFGKNVEMDESFFPGHPKSNKGRRFDEAPGKTTKSGCL